HQGKHLTLNVSITPLVSKSNERIGRLLLFDDVTQRERMEEQMTQTEKLTSLGLLAAGVAHEVNTPLAVISNYIQMLAKQMPEGDPRQSIIDKIVKQTFRASEIVNNLLNFSRTGAAEAASVDVNHVVEETLSLVAHPLKTSQIQVVKELSESLPPVHGSANKLQQVFLNLFLNARDAMPSGGMLEVRTAAHNGSVEIEIADTGAGIAREDINRIFDPFFTTKANGRGTGLGLSVSYGIIKEHAGKIDVRSTPGKGTSFHVEFPAARKAAHVKGLHPRRRRRIRDSRRPGDSAERRRLRRSQRRNRGIRARQARRASLRPFAAGRQLARPQRPGHAQGNSPPRSGPLGRIDHRLRLDRYGARRLQERRDGLHYQAVVQRGIARSGSAGRRIAPSSRRKSSPQARPEAALQFPEHHRQEREDASAAGSGCPGGALALDRAHQRRKRHRQGTHRQGAALGLSARGQSLCAGEYRLYS